MCLFFSVDYQKNMINDLLAQQLQSCMKLIARFLSQYNLNWALNHDLSEKGHFYGTYILL